MLFQGDAVWFSVPAILGTGVFVIRLILMLVAGVGDHGDVSVGVDGDVHGDSGQAFHILSVQGASALLMGFGWGGLAGLQGAGWGLGVSMLCGLGGGVFMVWLLAVMLHAVYGLESSGNISIDSALGVEGEVYASVPQGGAGFGQVRLVLENRQRIFRAVTDGPELPRSQRVKVVKVNSDNSVTVESV